MSKVIEISKAVVEIRVQTSDGNLHDHARLTINALPNTGGQVAVDFEQLSETEVATFATNDILRDALNGVRSVLGLPPVGDIDAEDLLKESAISRETNQSH